MLLGLKKLSRWAALLLTSVQSASAPRVVSHCAGTRAPFLQLAVACEGDDGDMLDRLASVVPVAAQRINRHHLEALSWAEQLRG